jgi:hypothetical protein
MALRAKYQQLIDTATNSGVTNLQVREQNNVLYIDGDAPSESVKQHCGTFITASIPTTVPAIWC